MRLDNIQGRYGERSNYLEESRERRILLRQLPFDPSPTPSLSNAKSSAAAEGVRSSNSDATMAIIMEVIGEARTIKEGIATKRSSWPLWSWWEFGVRSFGAANCIFMALRAISRSDSRWDTFVECLLGDTAFAAVACSR